MLQKTDLNTATLRIQLLKHKKRRKKLEMFANAVDLYEEKGENSAEVLQSTLSLKWNSLFYHCSTQHVCLSAAKWPSSACLEVNDMPQKPSSVLNMEAFDLREELISRVLCKFYQKNPMAD